MATQTEKLQEMLVLQDQTNATLDPAWRYNRSYSDFTRAAIVELAEFQDHMGYKWWSSKEPDIDQARMEVVDVWHFLLSFWALAAIPPSSLGPIVQESVGVKVRSPILHADELIHILSDFDDCEIDSDCWVEHLTYLGRSVGLEFDDIYRMYIGKAALNRFRWDHGYGSTYQKMWNGKEDNEYLTVILDDLWEGFTLQDVYDELNATYKSCGLS